MKKSFAITLGAIVSVFLFQAFTTIHEPKWQNLQILPQDISKQNLDSIMDHFSEALGVKCSFCHVRNNDLKKMEFAKDDKPEKHIARKMMLMSIDINKNHFEMIEEDMHDTDNASTVAAPADSVSYMLKYVTCYTCHKGKEQPVNTPPVKKQG